MDFVIVKQQVSICVGNRQSLFYLSRLQMSCAQEKCFLFESLRATGMPVSVSFK